jgi:hypothetical protein
MAFELNIRSRGSQPRRKKGRLECGMMTDLEQASG